jgi:predicted enzyme related to lactoylglutathione lyase
MAPEERTSWYVYWEVDDAAAATVRATGLGASVVTDAQDTPYGQLAALIDPTGARFNLRTSSG